MICKHCGKENADNARQCANCEAELPEQNGETTEYDSTAYESNLGFAKADSEYEEPQVLASASKANDAFSSSVNRAAASQTKTTFGRNSDRRGTDQKSTTVAEHKISRRKAKKNQKQRQQRLEQELKARLQESQEALNQYMYQGLNQDVIEEDETKNKRKSVKWSFLGIAVGLVMTACILIYMSSRSEKTDYTFITKDAIEIYNSQEEPVSYVFNAQGDMLYKLEGYFLPYYTSDHSAAILYDINERNCIYVNNNKIKNFNTVTEALAMSEDGNYVVYSTIGGLGKYYLRLYDATTDKDILLDNQQKHFELLNILPGGRRISYITYTMNERNELQVVQSYLITNNKTPELLGNNRCVYAVSTNGNDIYYYDLVDMRMGAFYVKHNGKDTLLSEVISSKLYFNRDYSQILIEDGGSYYLSIQGEERKKIADGLITGVLLPNKGAVATRSRAFHTYGIQSFGDKLLLSEDNSVWHLKQDMKSEKVAVIKNPMSVTLSEDGDTMIYIDPQDNLVRISDISGGAISDILAKAVTGYKATDDLSQIYFLREKRLYYIENKEEQLISEDVSDLCMNYERKVIFFLKKAPSGTGTLYYSRSGSIPKPVEGGNKVEGIREWNFGVLYQKYVNGSRAAFYNTEGKEFRFIMDGINLLEEGNRTNQQ